LFSMEAILIWLMAVVEAACWVHVTCETSISFECSKFIMIFLVVSWLAVTVDILLLVKLVTFVRLPPAVKLSPLVKLPSAVELPPLVKLPQELVTSDSICSCP